MMTILLGSYTDETYPDGLRLLDWDEVGGRLRCTAAYRVTNALYQALAPDGQTLYSCTGEGLASFRVTPGGLVPIDAVALGSCVCHVAVQPDGASVVWADYLAGCAGSVAVEAGRFGASERHVHEGTGPNLPRQDRAHCHQALPLPGGGRYCVVDLGLDRLVTYPDGAVTEMRPRGAGPRHLLFHPDGRTAFLVSELGNLLSLLRLTPDGRFETRATCSTLPAAASPRGPNGDLAAAVRLTPDGRRVVVSNRGENSLVAFDVDVEAGTLAPAARTLLPGSWPRDFVFTGPDRALAAMERSGEVHALAYDAATGRFEVCATLDGLFRPVALTPLDREERFA